MILVIGHLRLKPEDVAALKPHMDAVQAATRAETGCLLYTFAEDASDPGLIWLIERWRSWAALEAHLAASHMPAWLAAQKEVGVIDSAFVGYAAGETRDL